MPQDTLPHLQITSPQDLHNWLLENHGQEKGVWLVTFKKSVPDKYVDRWDVLDELLCFGWIDGRRMKLDDERTMQLITPRRVEHWSGTYKERVARLEQEGRMQPSGIESVKRGKESGLWDFLNDVDALMVPDDLGQALKKRPSAEAFFNDLPPSSKRFALRWLKLSKSEKTRANRIAKIVALSAEGKKVPGS